MTIIRLGIYLFGRTPLMGVAYDEKDGVRCGDTGVVDVARYRFANRHGYTGVGRMKKSDIVVCVADRTGLSRAAAENAVDAMLSAIEDALSRGEVVLISGFGRFSVRVRPAHTGRNPGTGASIPVRATKTPLFKAGKRLKDAVN